MSYPPPLDRLLAYGDCRQIKEMPDYATELGLSAEHIPDLIRMATDPELMYADSESSEVWAPIHAWRSLGQLRAQAAIEPLIELFADEEDDWIAEEMPGVFGEIGPAAIPTLSAYLQKKAHKFSPRITAASCLRAIAQHHPEVREECIALLTEQLSSQAGNSLDFNGFIICDLIDLKAVESAAAIERAFAEKRVELFMAGDWEAVQESMGLKTRLEILEARAGQPDFTHALKPEQTEHRKATQGFGSATGKKSGKVKKKKKKK